jgi:hypothetical protein
MGSPRDSRLREGDAGSACVGQRRAVKAQTVTLVGLVSADGSCCVMRPAGGAGGPPRKSREALPKGGAGRRRLRDDDPGWWMR